MNFKTLLLGTAAALSVVGGAQAADLRSPEPVDYVKASATLTASATGTSLAPTPASGSAAM